VQDFATREDQVPAAVKQCHTGTVFLPADNPVSYVDLATCGSFLRFLGYVSATVGAAFAAAGWSVLCPQIGGHVVSLDARVIEAVRKARCIGPLSLWERVRVRAVRR
jgi:hypothetical protein